MATIAKKAKAIPPPVSCCSAKPKPSDVTRQPASALLEADAIAANNHQLLSTSTTKGIQQNVITTRAQTKHPLDPLSGTEISVAVATVRAAGATPEVRDSMRFVEVVLLEPEKHVVALADAYFFPPVMKLNK